MLTRRAITDAPGTFAVFAGKKKLATITGTTITLARQLTKRERSAVEVHARAK